MPWLRQLNKYEIVRTIHKAQQNKTSLALLATSQKQIVIAIILIIIIEVYF